MIDMCCEWTLFNVGVSQNGFASHNTYQLWCWIEEHVMAKVASSYRRKKDAGLCGQVYDVDSKKFNEGAWKNLSPSEYRRNQNALKGGANV